MSESMDESEPGTSTVMIEDPDDHEMPENVLDFLEANLETEDIEEIEDDDDCFDGNVVEVEPEICFQEDDDEDEENDGNNKNLSMHNNGQSYYKSEMESSINGEAHFLQGLGDDSRLSYNSSSQMTPNTSFKGGGNRKTYLGTHCPICGQQLHRQHARDHVACHFMDELKSLISDPNVCPEPNCPYTAEKMENVARHLALKHSKLDYYLTDHDLIEQKRALCLSKPKKVSIGSSCIICGLKDPAREHVSRHFMKELLDIVNSLPDQLNCPSCSYSGERPQNLARHIALVHSKLDELLQDSELVEERKREFLAKPNKLSIGPNCPVCQQQLSKQHSRVHVIWHFMDELRAMVNEFQDPNQCDLCEYSNKNSDKIAKHIALGHSKLDELLLDEELVSKKREKALLKPKKENIGPLCPICDVRDPPREHVARHFGAELSEYVSHLPDQLNCNECNYRGEKVKNLELHVGLVHGLLDHFLKDSNLILEKRKIYMSTPKKQAIGPQCPICDMKFTKTQNRDHVSWHFMDELRHYVKSFQNPQVCDMCSYTSEKIDNLVKHVALGHSKLDELLQNSELVAQKRAIAKSKPKKISIGPLCPVCDVRDPAREHVARHFSEELMVYINELTDHTQCNLCDYRADKAKTLAIHVALVHGKLDAILCNDELVNIKRASFMSKPKKQTIGPKCPVCDIQFTKNQNRDHVSWHYMDELRAIVNDFPNPLQCTECSYTSDTIEKMVKHVALGHSMLDGFLQDAELLEIKRMKALSKPKKVSLGPNCPVCDVKDPPREHVARHFGDELVDIVMDFPSTTQCTQCNYSNDKIKNVAIHIALVHNILDQLLTDEDLVKTVRERHLSKPQKVNLGNKCPVCDVVFSKGQNRDHVCWHFMDELREIVNEFDNKEACPDCNYTSDKLDNLVKHVALGHSKLDELLQNKELVEAKRALVQAKPKKVSIGPTCPICDMKFVKGQNRDHVSWHFMDELRAFVRSTGQENDCTICEYTTDKLDNLVKHYALGHCKLDEMLQDEKLIEAKREIVKNKPKRLSFGKDCPICEQTGRDRDHIARHFMPELMEMVDALPNRTQCDQCEYSNSKDEYMAKHIALKHCKLDEMMQNKELVASKIEKAKKIPKKMSMGNSCIICQQIGPSREHVARHFLQELMKMIIESPDKEYKCPECSFARDNPEYVARHLGLVHCQVDVLVSNAELVAEKIKEHESKIPNQIKIVQSLPLKTLPMRESVRKSQRQKEYEEKMAKAEKEKEEFEKIRKREENEIRKIEAERKKEEQIRKRKAAEEAKKLAAEMGRSSKKIKLESKSNSPQSLLEMTLLSDNKSSFAGLQNVDRGPTLYEKASSIAKSILVNNKKEETTIGQITIKRTTPAQWRVKPMDNKPTLDEPITHIEPIVKNEYEPEEEEHHEIEPDISHLMEISHNMEDEEDELMYEDGESMVICPEIIMTEGDEELVNETIPDDEFCEMCGVELNQHANPCQSISINTDEMSKFDICPVCDLDSPSREHISRHFIEELSEVVEGFPDPHDCPQCSYHTDRNNNLAVHIAIAHAQLEKCVEDSSLVQSRRSEFIVEPMNDIQQPVRQSGQNSSLYCPVCNQALNKSHSRDHIVWHFMDELRAMIPSDTKSCPSCNYKGEKPDNLARHLALYHGQLDVFLQDEELVMQKRMKSLSKPKKAHIGNSCPVCDFKDPPREHVSRHFMPELLEHLDTLPHKLQCSECNYKGEKPQNLAKHIALVHSMLDKLLGDKELVNSKRMEFLAKPKKVSIGECCPVCEMNIPKRDSRVHVIWHFMDDLRQIVSQFADQRVCDLCGYKNPRPDKMAKHLALGHSKLDELLRDEELVLHKKELAINKPKKLVIGPVCPICDIKFSKNQNRDHVAWHFMDELREIVMTFPNSTACIQCSYTSDKVDNLVKHIALGHSKLDELMQNQELVAMKRQQALSKPKKISIGPICPICDLKFTKQQNRDHVSCHFSEELRSIVYTFPDPQACVLCSYTSDKMENMIKHLALGHSKLDEFLQDEELVAYKRENVLNKPKKEKSTPLCPICDSVNPSKDHVLEHFMEELTEYVELKLPNKTSCHECNFEGNNTQDMAKHVAINHNKLDELLFNNEFIQDKRDVYRGEYNSSSSPTNNQSPQRKSLSPVQNLNSTPTISSTSEVSCQICEITMMKKSLREHLSKHFNDELREIVREFRSSNRCQYCKYSGKKEGLLKHVALVHGKLDEFLLDDNLVQQKKDACALAKEEKLTKKLAKNIKTEDDVTIKEEPDIKMEEENNIEKHNNSDDSSSSSSSDEENSSDSKKELASKWEQDTKLISMNSMNHKTIAKSNDGMKITIRRTPKKPTKLREEYVTVDQLGKRKNNTK